MSGTEQLCQAPPAAPYSMAGTAAAPTSLADRSDSTGNIKPHSPSYKPQQLSQLAPSAKPAPEQRPNVTLAYLQLPARNLRPGSRGITATGVCSGDQPWLSGLRSRASPTLNPVTPTALRVSLGRGGGIQAHLWAQRPPCPALALPVAQTILAGSFLSFLLGEDAAAQHS